MTAAIGRRAARATWAAASSETLEVDAGIRAIEHSQHGGHLFQRSIVSALAQPADGDGGMAHAGAGRSQRVGSCKAEVVVGMEFEVDRELRRQLGDRFEGQKGSSTPTRSASLTRLAPARAAISITRAR